MIKVTQKGDFSKTLSFMDKALKVINKNDFEKYGKEGVAALSAATPKS